MIRHVLKKPADPQDVPAHNVILLSGILRGLHLDKDWIEVNVDGENKFICDAKEEIDDVIGPMVDHRVVVEVLERPERSEKKKYSFRDIQLEEDL